MMRSVDQEDVARVVVRPDEDDSVADTPEATAMEDIASEEQIALADLEQRVRILRASTDLDEEERARREEELWAKYEEEHPVPKEEEPTAEEPKKTHKRKLSLGPLKLNNLSLAPFDNLQHRIEVRLNKAEQRFEKGLQSVGKEVKLVLSTTPKAGLDEEDISFEAIERVKVNSLAGKTLSKKNNKWQLKKRKIHYWLMCFEIGFLVGLVEFLNHEGLAQIQNGRINIAKYFIKLGTPLGMFAAWAVYTLLALLATLFGTALCVYVSPIAKGGGIAEVKAFLNGVKMPGLLSLKTCLVKLVSTMCSVGAGLAVGQEGPMIHIGSSIAYVCSQMKFKTFPKLRQAFSKFQNDRDARDFVASGAAAGVSAAFRSPIGATLFSLEEAASFWSHELIWRTFFCCMIAAWSTNFFIGGTELGIENLINNPSHVVYRVALTHGFKLPELFCFFGIGIIGGLLGALFIKINMKINAYRKKTYYKENRWKFLELAVIAVITATLSIVAPMAFSCRDITTDLPNLNNDNEDNSRSLETQVFEPFTCNSSTQYNPMASLSFANSEIVLKHLYIQSNPRAFGVVTLFFFSLVYYILMAITSGTWIAAGLLVPQLICGAAIGRLYGYILALFLDVDPGIYALLGSSAFMAGVSRLTIALVIIMIEITNNLEALLPIMTVCMISKWVGDMFNHSIYDEALHAGGVPFLEPDPPKLAAVMSCKDAMVAEREHVPEKATVEQCYLAMKDTDDSHKNIPVVDTGDDGKALYLKGSIPRSHLAILLQERAYEKNTLINVGSIPLRNAEISFSPAELAMTVDLKPYTNVATFVVHEEFPLYLAYRIFRGQGLRELFVVSERNELRGRITRPQLIIHDDHAHKPHAHPHEDHKVHIVVDGNGKEEHELESINHRGSVEEKDDHHEDHHGDSPNGIVQLEVQD